LGAPRVSRDFLVSSTLVLQARRSQLGKIFSYQRSLDHKIVSRLLWAGASDGCLFHSTRRRIATTRADDDSGPGGAGRDRTDDLRLAKPALSQLSYSPVAQIAHGPGEPRSEASSIRPGSYVEVTALMLCNIRQQELVGLGGLEPPTSRLSGGRSNHLSYRP
jgi:hypothetical protein